MIGAAGAEAETGKREGSMMNQDRVTEHSGIDSIGNTADSSHTDSIDMKIESRYLEQALRLHRQHPVRKRLRLRHHRGFRTKSGKTA